MKVDSIAPVRHFDDDVVVSAFVVIVIEQLEPQSARLHANRRIRLWIKIPPPPENFGSDLILLQGGAGLRQLVLRQVTKQFAERLCFAQGMAVNQLLNLLKIPRFVSDLDRGNRHVTYKSKAC
jgi:hypothetical protein